MKKTIFTMTLAAFLVLGCLTTKTALPEQDDAVLIQDSQPSVQKQVLAILPFHGGGPGVGETVASLFMHQPALLEAFKVVTRSSADLAVILAEHHLQLTGQTDSDTIADLGHILDADYVLSGSISSLGDKNILIATIVNVNTYEQVAGSYYTYNNLGEAPDFLPLLSKNMVNTVSQRGVAMRETLSTVPFTHHSRINPNDALSLTEILAIELINTGRYAILPRTSTIQAARREQGFRMEEGEIRALGQAANANLVLSGNIGSLGDANVFIAQILRVADGTVVIGSNRNYGVIAEGINLMPEIAILLTEPDAAVAQARIEERRHNEKIRLEEEKRAQEAAAAEARRAQETAAALERREREAENRKVQQAVAAAERKKRKETASARRKTRWEETIDDAYRTELEFFAVYYATDGDNSGLSLGSFISGAYWSPFPFANIGIEPGVNAIAKGSFFSLEGITNLTWYFNVSPSIGVVFPLGEAARIFANSVFDFNFWNLPGKCLILNWTNAADKFSIGITPGFNTGFSFGYESTFNIKYSFTAYHDKIIHAVGMGFGKRY